MKKISYYRLILAIIVVNLAGFTLRYFEYDTYIILLGFRFHLSFVLPLLVIYPENFFIRAKEFLVNPYFKKKFFPVLWIIIPSGLILSLLFLLNKIELADPEYFYEFGLSSIFDYPIYLVWNFPQFFLLFSFILFGTERFRNKFVPVLLITIFLFVYEFIPVDFEILNYFSLIELVLISVVAALLIQFYQNVYWYAAVLFSVIWSGLLAFGSSSGTLINILFASQYSKWEGFFEANKELSLYLIPAQFFVLTLLLLISVPFAKKQDINKKRTI